MSSLLNNSKIQTDMTATNLNLNCDPRLKGPEGSVLDVKSRAGKIAVEDNICELSGPNLNSGGTSTTGVTQIVAGTNVTINPASGTGVVTINSTGGGGGALPAATTAMDSGLNGPAKIHKITKEYFGYNNVYGTFSFADLAKGWTPFVVATVVTHGIPKLAGIIRSF